MAKRTAITVRGIDLLSLINAAGVVGLMLTQDEGAEAVTAGDAVVDPTVTDGDTAKVTLTDQGRGKLPAIQTANLPAANKPTFTLSNAVAIPTAKRGRGGRGETLYPFDQMEVGQSFHIPKTAENPDPAEKIASSVSGARAKYAVKSGEQETVKVKTYAKDANGKFVKVDGKRVVAGESEVTRDKMTIVRDFITRSVDKTDPDGEGARVWRTA